MPGKAAKVVITERQQDILLRLSRSVTIAFQLRQRAQIILLGFEGRLNSEIEEIVGLGHDAVGRWRRRWQQEFERLTLVEGLEEPADLRRAIEGVLSDEQRSGRPTTFTAEQLTMIFAVACEAVEESGRPVARWTQREIIDEVVKRGIIASISTSHLSTLLAEAQLQPHKSRYWLNTKETDPEVFNTQVQTVCDCYQQAPERLAQFDTHTVCIDEMTGIQALERIAPKKHATRSRRTDRVRIHPPRHGVSDRQLRCGQWGIGLSDRRPDAHGRRLSGTLQTNGRVAPGVVVESGHGPTQHARLGESRPVGGGDGRAGTPGGRTGCEREVGDPEVAGDS